MNDKRLYAIARYYATELRQARKDTPCVSAGELAKRIGVSRATAKKNLEMACRLGYVIAYDFEHVNKTIATAYAPA